MTEVCNDVCVEPDLQALSSETMARRTANTTDNARLDIAANGFWGGRLERTFIDVGCLTPMHHRTGARAWSSVSENTN